MRIAHPAAEKDAPGRENQLLFPAGGVVRAVELFADRHLEFQFPGGAGGNLILFEHEHRVSVAVHVKALILGNAGEPAPLCGEEILWMRVDGCLDHSVGLFLPVGTEHVASVSVLPVVRSML